MKLQALSSSRASTEIAWALLAVGIAFAVFWHLLGLASLRFDVPMIYKGDALPLMYTYDIAQRTALGAPGSTGMPFGTTLYDAPNADGFNLLLIEAFDLLTGQFGAAFNLFFLATIVLVGLSAYAVGRKLGLTSLWACTLSVLFNLLPFHLQRLGHLFFANYAVAAIAIWLALDVVAESRVSDGKRRPRLIVVLAAIVCGSSGIYYAWFSCLFIGTATAAALLAKPARAVATRGFIVLALVAGTAGAGLLPSALYRWQHGVNTMVAQREPSESEVYGLKLSQMVLPIEGHRIAALADLKRAYEAQSPLVNENKTATLGIFGAVGFLLLLATPFLGNFRERLPQSVQQAAPLAWVGFLYATIGGLGSLVAWVVSPQLRGLNRISIFLGFIALFAFVAVAQTLAARLRMRFAAGSFATLVMALGILDMTPSTYAHALPERPLLDRTLLDRASLDPALLYPAFQARFDSDKQFAAQLENRLPAGSMLFQLPYVDYPESPILVNLEAYDLLAPVLQAKRLRWTYGAMRGREEARWYEIVASLAPAKLIDALGASGFRGVVINRQGYADRAGAIEKALLGLGLKPDVTSADHDSVMYALANSADAGQMAVAAAPGQGWHQTEFYDFGAAVWSRGSAEVMLSNVASTRTQCRLSLPLMSLVARKVALMDESKILGEAMLVPGSFVSLAGDVQLIAGARKRLTIQTDVQARTAGNGDPRLLAFFWKMESAPLCR